MGPPVMNAAFDSPRLTVVPYRSERIQVVDFYEENPVGSFRGIALATIFSLLLVVLGLGGWILWKLLY